MEEAADIGVKNTNVWSTNIRNSVTSGRTLLETFRVGSPQSQLIYRETVAEEVS